MDRKKIGVGSLLVVVSTVVMFVTGMPEVEIPATSAVLAVASLAIVAGTLLVGFSGEPGQV